MEQNGTSNLQFNWQLLDNKLTISFKVKDFSEGAWFIDEVAKIAEELNHHPDVALHDYNQITLSTTTHDAGKVTDKDYELAEKVDALITRIQ